MGYDTLLQIVEGSHPLWFKLGEKNKKKSVWRFVWSMVNS